MWSLLGHVQQVKQNLHYSRDHIGTRESYDMDDQRMSAHLLSNTFMSPVSEFKMSGNVFVNSAMAPMRTAIAVGLSFAKAEDCLIWACLLYFAAVVTHVSPTWETLRDGLRM